MKWPFFFFNCVVSCIWGGAAIRVHFSSCKLADTETVMPPPSLNSLNCLQFTSRKCRDFPSSPPYPVKGRCLYSVPGTGEGSPCKLEALQPSTSCIQSCLPLPSPRLILFKASAHTRIILPLSDSLFLKLQSCAAGQMLLSRHHQSACLSVQPTLLSALFHLFYTSSRFPWELATSCSFLSRHATTIHTIF